MKKIIRAICALIAIGVFILATQISCQKSNAQASGNSSTSPGLILYYNMGNTTVPSDSGRTNTIGVYNYYIANIDGSNQRQIPINLPAGLYVGFPGYLTANGQTLVFTTFNQPGTIHTIYSCTSDGSNLRKVMDLANQTQLLGA